MSKMFRSRAARIGANQSRLARRNRLLKPCLERLEDRRVFAGPNTLNPGGPYGPLPVGSDLILRPAASDPDNTLLELTFRWDLNGDNNFNDLGVNPSIVPYASLAPLGIVPDSVITKQYNIRVRVSDPQGNSLTGSTTLSLMPNFPPNVNAGGPYQLSFGLRELSLFGTADDLDSGFPPSPPIVTWDLNNDGIFGDAGVTTANAIVSFTQLKALGMATVGAHTLRMKATDIYGASAIATATLNITNSPPTSVDAGPPGIGYGPVGPGQSVTLLASAFDSDDDFSQLTYAWDLNNDGSYSENVSGASPTVTYAKLQSLNYVNGPNTIRVKVTDPFGAFLVSAPTSINFIVNQPPVVKANGPYVMNDHILPINLTGAGTVDPDGNSNLLIYDWDLNNDGNFSDRPGGPNGQVSVSLAELRSFGVTTAGVHTIRLRATDVAGAAGVATTTLTINNQAPVISFAGPPDRPYGPISSGMTLNLIGSAFDADDTVDVTYRWDLNADGTFDATGSSATVTYTQLLALGLTTGNHPIKLRVTDPFGAFAEATSSVDFVGNVAPIARPGGPYAYLGSPITLDARGSSDPDSTQLQPILNFLWDLDNDGQFDDANTSTVAIAAAQLVGLGINTIGPHTIRLKVTDEYGASAIASTTLSVLDTPPTPTAGSLDLTFGAGGIVTTDFAGAFDSATHVAIAPDGGILVAGTVGASPVQQILIRYNSAGERDMTFGSGGKVVLPFEARDLAVLSSGAIYVAGTHVVGATGRIGLARYTAQGAIDSSYGTSGIASVSVGAIGDEVTCIAVQTDGKVLVTAWSIQSTTNGLERVSATVVRFATNGSLDSSFASAGKLVINQVTQGMISLIDRVEPFGIALLPSGQFVIGINGHGQDGFALARYSSAGVLDTTFGTSSSVPVSPSLRGTSLALQSGGGIVVAVQDSLVNNLDFSMMRFSPAGNVDATFGNDTGPAASGLVRTAIGTGADQVARVVVLDSGRILLVGSAQSAHGSDIAMARYDSSGVLDQDFFGAGTGKVITDINAGRSAGLDVAIQPDGKIVLAGFASASADNRNVAVVRYLSESTSNNSPPVARAGGPYTLVEGGSVKLDGYGSTDPDQLSTTLFYNWDFDGDGLFDDGVGAQPDLMAASLTTLSPVIVDGPNSFTVKLRVTDAAGVSSTATATINVTNAPPTILQVDGSTTGFNTSSSIAILAQDPWQGDVLTYAFDFDNNGTYEVSNATGIALHTYTALGDYVVPFKVSDDDGGVTTGTAQLKVVPSVRFDAVQQTFGESAGTVRILARLSHPLTEALTVPVIVGNTTTQGNADFLFTTQSVTFAAGATTGEVTLQLVNDALFEPNETITLAMTPPASTAAKLSNSIETVVTIVDDDPLPIVRFTAASQRTDEKVTTLNVVVELTTVYAAPVTIPIQVSGTALYNGDYRVTGWPVQQPSSQNVIIPVGQTRATVQLDILDDTVGEATESIFFTLLTPTNGLLSNLPGNPKVHSVFIEKNDEPLASFDVASRKPIVEGTEFSTTTASGTFTVGPKAVTVTALLSNFTNTLVTIPLNFGGSAVVGSDYCLSNAGSGTMNCFSAPAPEIKIFSGNTGTYTFYLRGDTSVENTENIIVTMGTPTSAGIGSITKTSFDITDDDVLTVRFEGDEYTQRFWEDEGTVTLKARLTGGTSDVDLTVPVSVLTANAIENKDFQLPNASIFFPAGSSTGDLKIKLLNDSDAEDLSEYFTVKIIGNALVRADSSIYRTPSYAEKRIEILDDDPVVNVDLFTGSSYGSTPYINENALPAIYSFSLSHPTNKPVTFAYNVAGTVSAADYAIAASSPTTITIPAGQTKASQQVKITAVHDGLKERNESFWLELKNIVNALGSTSPKTVIFDDDKGTIEFATAGIEVGERVGTTQMTLNVSPPAPGLMLMNLRIKSATANSNDYRVPVGTFLFMPGQSSASLNVEILDDDYQEPDETVVFTIESSDPNYRITDKNQFKLTIFRNDEERPAQPGALAIDFSAYPSDNVAPTYTGPIAKSKDPPPPSIPTTLAIDTGATASVGDGLMSGSMLFFDANKNRIRDYLDSNSNGFQDAGEPSEPVGVSRADGRVIFNVPAAFDRNGDGVVGITEGQLVATGGIDISTGLTIPNSYMAPTGTFVINPISTLAAELVNQFTLTPADAFTRLIPALGLPLSASVDLTLFDPVTASAAGDPMGTLFYAANAAIQNVASEIAGFVSPMPGAPPKSDVAQEVFRVLARMSASEDASLLLDNPVTVEVVLRSVLDNFGLIATAQVIETVGVIIAGSNEQMLALSRVNAVGASREIARRQIVAQKHIADVLALLGSGSISLQSALDQTTGSGLTQLTSAARALDIVPPTITIATVRKSEGNAGSTSFDFIVSLSHASTQPVSVDFTTLDLTAIAGEDYTSASGTLTWQPGDTVSKTVSIAVAADNLLESDETFLFRVGGVVGATLQQRDVEATIVNDEPLVYVAPAGVASQMSMLVSGDTIQLIRNNLVVFAGSFSTPLPITVTGSSNTTNTLVVTLEQPGAFFRNGMTYNGGSLNDSFTLIDETSPVLRHIPSGTNGDVIVDGATIHYQSVEFVALPSDVNDAPVLLRGITSLSVVPSSSISFPLQAFINSGSQSTRISDADPTDPVGGVAITNVASNGTFYYSLDNGFNFVEIPKTLSATSALVLPREALMRYESGTGVETAIVTFVAWDQSDQLTPGSLTNTFSQLTTAYSTNSSEILIQVHLADSISPQSTVLGLPQYATSLQIPIIVAGVDPQDGNGVASGLKEFDVYVAEDSGPFVYHATVPAANPELIYTATSNHVYFFRSVARDIAGNQELITAGGDTFTRVGDFDKPVTEVTSAVASATGQIVLGLTGRDTGGSRLVQFDLYVAVDNAAPVLVGSLVTGATDPSAISSVSTTYQGLTDGAPHSYRFFSRGKDSLANIEDAPATGDRVVNATFAAPAALGVTSIDVQGGTTQRSFVRYLDVNFNTATGVPALLSNNRVRVEKFALNATNVAIGTGTAVSFVGAVQGSSSNRIQLDFGSQGLGGARNTVAGDGFYRVMIDINGDGDSNDPGEAFEFYRLLGDANGDRTVDELDTAAVDRFYGASGDFLDGDLNGDGVVNSIDKGVTQRTYRGRTLNAALAALLDD